MSAPRLLTPCEAVVVAMEEWFELEKKPGLRFSRADRSSFSMFIETSQHRTRLGVMAPIAEAQMRRAVRMLRWLAQEYTGDGVREWTEWGTRVFTLGADGLPSEADWFDADTWASLMGAIHPRRGDKAALFTERREAYGVAPSPPGVAIPDDHPEAVRLRAERGDPPRGAGVEEQT